MACGNLQDLNRDNAAEICPSSLSSQSRPITMKLLMSVDLPKTGDDDKEPFLTGLDFLPDGRLIAVDFRNKQCIILNERLQRLGTPYNFNTLHGLGTYYKSNSTPCDVVCFSPNKVAVTLGKLLCLLSVSTDNVIRLAKIMETSTKFFSICCKSPSQMVVSSHSDVRAVRMVSLDGWECDFDTKIINLFPMETYKMGKSCCTYVQSTNTLVLIDTLAQKVYMYDTVKGESRAVTDKEIHAPCGACVGPDETVLVCSMGNNSIVHLTIDGKIIGTYPVDMTYPYSICVSKNGTRLAVSNINWDGITKLHLYKISTEMS